MYGKDIKTGNRRKQLAVLCLKKNHLPAPLKNNYKCFFNPYKNCADHSDSKTPGNQKNNKPISKKAIILILRENAKNWAKTEITVARDE